MAAELEEPGRQFPNLHAIVDRIAPAVTGLLDTDLRDDPQALMREAVRANIRSGANQIRHSSSLLEQLIAEDGLYARLAALQFRDSPLPPEEPASGPGAIAQE